MKDLAGPSFPRALREARAMSGLSQAQVARRLQMSTSGYRLWEYGRRQVLVIHLPSLAAALGVPAATLMQWATS